MTAADLARLIGLAATLSVRERSGATLSVPVTILDARTAYGNEHVLVSPDGGDGQAWVSTDRVRVRT